MPIPLTVGIHSDGDIATLSLAGELNLSQVPRVRAALYKCLAEVPAAVLVDLSGLAVGSELSLAVFPSVARAAARWPAVPLVFFGATGPLGARLAHNRSLCVRADRAAALAVPAAARPVLRVDLDFDPGVVYEARHLVAHACEEWGVAGQSADAQVIVSELVSNALRHAAPPLRLVVALRGAYLHVAVQDGSPGERPPDPGRPGRRGLYLVDALATASGTWFQVDSKAVWAVLRVQPVIRSAGRGRRTGDWVRR